MRKSRSGRWNGSDTTDIFLHESTKIPERQAGAQSMRVAGRASERMDCNPAFLLADGLALVSC